MTHILRRSVQTPSTPPPQTPPDHGKSPSSLPRVHTPSLPKVDPPTLPKEPTIHRYPTRHTCHNQTRPVIATAGQIFPPNSPIWPRKATWEISTANEFFRLAQGGGKSCIPSKKIDGTNTIFFVSRHTIPKDKNLCQLRLRHQALQD